MNSSPEEALKQARIELDGLWEETRSLMLATEAEDGYPEVSYAPYVRGGDGCLYVFVSGLARHTRNLGERPRVSVLLVEDEGKARQIFARKRLSYRCTVDPVSRDDPAWGSLIDAFAARHGEVVSVLRDLPDFILFRLQPRSGNLVIGFGQAYRLTGEDLRELEPVRPASQ